MHRLFITVSCFFTCLIISFISQADTYIRYNHAGYTPERTKQLIVMSDEKLAGQSWQIFDQKEQAVITGVLSTSIIGITDHTPKAFNYVIDASSLTELGQYKVSVNNIASVTIQIRKKPYQQMLSELLRFLRVARSGTSDTLITPISHLGDAKTIVYQPIGEVSEGKWQAEKPVRTLDMLGGWYDAADYIKFTLTTAYTSYYLGRAYQEAPELFSKKYSQTQYVDIIDELKHGLDYLMKTMPSDDEFVIQVSTGIDHKMGYRLPQDDTRDGKREALVALSPAQMGLTSAALALGADIFGGLGEDKLAEKYLKQAQKIYTRARQSDVTPHTAFERDATNDFYLDKQPADNMGLAAIELYRVTKQEHYLQQAKLYSAQAGNDGWSAWCCVTVSLNYRLSGLDGAASALFAGELLGYQNYDKNNGNIWGIPMVPSWAPLPGQAIAGAYAGLKYQTNSRYEPTLLWNNLDYYFGRNNWGVSFIALPDLDNAVANTYSQVYQLTGEYPLGAVSEGPGSKESYQALKHFFKPSPLDQQFEKFNTTSQIFYDNSSNFQTMESTIVGQAAAIYLLAVAEKITQSP